MHSAPQTAACGPGGRMADGHDAVPTELLLAQEAYPMGDARIMAQPESINRVDSLGVPSK
jgi:hypothetical protein